MVAFSTKALRVALPALLCWVFKSDPLAHWLTVSRLEGTPRSPRDDERACGWAELSSWAPFFRVPKVLGLRFPPLCGLPPRPRSWCAAGLVHGYVWLTALIHKCKMRRHDFVLEVRPGLLTDVPAGSGVRSGCCLAACRQLTSPRPDVGAKERRASAGRLQHTVQPALAGTCAVRPGLALGARYRRRT